jgi:indolepyruvate ferredoxin oxidoreductase beta subunit
MTREMSVNPDDRAITLLVCALGGEGGGVLADWLVAVARACGHPAQGTSIPGVAQRTGATTYYLEIFPRPESELGGRKPVFGLYAVPGGVDLLVGSELLEVARQAQLGMISPDRTAVIASTRRTLTTAEKMQPADGRMDDADLIAVLQGQAASLDLIDMTGQAQRAGTVISAVMLGAIGAWFHASGRLPWPRAAYEDAIRAGGKGAEASLRGFEAAWERIDTALRQRAGALRVADEVAAALRPAAPVPVVPKEVAIAFAPALHAIVSLGLARVTAYQDVAYGALYLDRLARLRDADRQPDQAATAEAARWLALWMAFDDIVRVAQLKSHVSRFERVRREVRAGEGELLRLHDHFKPGVPEIAALLPPRLAAALRRWDTARIAQGREPWAQPLRLATHGVAGLVALRLLAALRPLRRHGERYGEEQRRIEHWLAAVRRGLQEDAALGLELARCGRLNKGYGATHDRGWRHLQHLIDHLAFTTALGDAAARAAAVAQAREAALADDTGTALDATLRAQGAMPRPLAEQPVRWVRRRPHAS